MWGFLKGEHAWNLLQGLELPGGVWGGCRACPTAVCALPLFPLHRTPLTLAQGWRRARQRRGEQLQGISRASRGRWEPPFPSSFRPSPPSLSLLFPSSTSPSSLSSSLFPSFPTGDKEESGAGQSCVQGLGVARQGLGACVESRLAGQLLEE